MGTVGAGAGGAGAAGAAGAGRGGGGGPRPPVVLALGRPFGVGGPRVGFVDEAAVVADEAVVLHRPPLAQEGVAGDLAAGAHRHVLLDLDECADAGVIADAATVEVH